MGSQPSFTSFARAGAALASPRTSTSSRSGKSNRVAKVSQKVCASRSPCGSIRGSTCFDPLSQASRNTLLLSVVLISVVAGAAQEVEVNVANGTGYGTVGIYARTFGTVILKSGSAITYVSDAVNGDSFVINTTGLYAVSYTDGDLAAYDVGVSVNLSPTTKFSASWGTALELCGFVVSNSGGSCSATVHLSKGSVLRAHGNFGGASAKRPTHCTFHRRENSGKPRLIRAIQGSQG